MFGKNTDRSRFCLNKIKIYVLFINTNISFAAVDFFNQINMLYGTITDFCTEESCPVMSAGPK